MQATVSDRKIPVSSNGTTIDYYNADVVSANYYYPFGMIQPGRNYNAGGYRYGFNGKENDNEAKGEGNQIDYGMRVYDPRVGRFLSVDPLTDQYPWYTPYQYAGNKPIWCIDLDGLEDIPTNGGHYYSVQQLKDMAFRDPIVTEAISRKERVMLNQTYRVNGKNLVQRQIVLNEGTVGGNIQNVNQDGSFWESGALASRVTTTFSGGGIYQPTPPAPELPAMPQNPPNPPVSDSPKPDDTRPMKPKPPKPKPQNPPKSKPPINKPTTPVATPDPPAPAPPNAADFCLTCFNGESDAHWDKGVGQLADFLSKNPNYNLKIRPDGNSTILGRGWDGGTGLFGGGPTYKERALQQFRKLQNAIKALGIQSDRINIGLGKSTGKDLSYEVEKRNKYLCE